MFLSCGKNCPDDEQPSKTLREDLLAQDEAETKEAPDASDGDTKAFEPPPVEHSGAKSSAALFDGYPETEDVKSALTIIEGGVVKVDHFENINRIEPRLEGAPNLRQAKGFLIFGTGQPTLSAVARMFEVLQRRLSVRGVIWFNMRSEPVLYVNGISYAPRHAEHLSENIHFEGDLSTKDVSYIEHRLTQVVADNVRHSEDEHTFIYHKDTYALLPADRKDMVMTDTVADPSKDVRSLLQTYEDLKQSYAKKGFGVAVHRLPVNDERAPDGDDMNTLVALVKDCPKDTALVFNCQMGKGRTTMGMICACLVRKHLVGHSPATASHSHSSATADDSLFDKQMAAASAESEAWDWPIDTPVISSEEARDDGEQKRLSDKLKKREAEIVATEIATTSIKSEDGTSEMDVVDISGLSTTEMRNGNFSIILELCEILSGECKVDGGVVKEEVDDVIDRCQHLQSMRTCIYMTRVWFLRETEERRKYWKRISVSFLERYFVLLCFDAYVRQCAADRLQTTYTEWYARQRSIQDLADTLPNFNWD